MTILIIKIVYTISVKSMKNYVFNVVLNFFAARELLCIHKKILKSKFYMLLIFLKSDNLHYQNSHPSLPSNWEKNSICICLGSSVAVGWTVSVREPLAQAAAPDPGLRHHHQQRRPQNERPHGATTPSQ
jgi:hypothetical protein